MNLEDKNFQVYKGHFDLDTDQRVSDFREKMAVGWEPGGYEEYRDAWEQNPKKFIVSEYPLQVDMELSSKCNLSCPMCYTTRDDFINSVDRLFMDFDLFKKIVDEVAAKIYAMRLSWRGESTLYPHFIEAIRYAKSKGIKEISFLTNGSTLDLDYFIEMAEAGVDWISISIDGVGEQYEKIRKPLKFLDIVEKLNAIKGYKDRKGLLKPTIKVQTIWPAIRSNPTEYYEIFRPISDLVAFNPLIDYLGKDKDIVYENNFCCPQLYERLFVASDGKVMMCNSDEFGKQFLGNAFDQTIHEIWHGEKLNKIRKIHNKKDGFKQIDICKKCFFPRKMEVTETAEISGRKIFIENYINRKQEIGE